jgi:hypothetical protein
MTFTDNPRGGGALGTEHAVHQPNGLKRLIIANSLTSSKSFGSRYYPFNQYMRGIPLDSCWPSHYSLPPQSQL